MCLIKIMNRRETKAEKNQEQGDCGAGATPALTDSRSGATRAAAESPRALHRTKGLTLEFCFLRNLVFFH